MSYSLDATVTLSVEWRAYQGGPVVTVTGVQFKATPLAGGAAVIGPTATGVTNPSQGINVYAASFPGGTAAGDYLITWTGTDPAGDTVTATEIITLTTATGIGGAYASLAELKAWMKIPDSKTDRDAELTRRLASSALDINRWCHRQFGRDEVATTRTFFPDRCGVDVHDFWTTDNLAIVPYLGTTAGTAWDMSTLVLEPLDGIVDMVPGWPYNRITSGLGGHPLTANLFYVAASVKVTAKWGWASVPDNVNTANLVLAAADSKASDTPFGVAGFGDYAVRIRSNPIALEKLDPYVYKGTAANSFMVAAG